MKKILTPRQKQVLNFIRGYYSNNGYAPSLEEIADELNVSALSTVHQHVDALNRKGYLRKEAFQHRGAIPLNENNNNIVDIPLLGQISAGKPIDVIENPQTIQIPKSMIRDNSEYYALEVVGNSMITDGICDGDIILLKNQNVAEIGETVVAVISGAATLKRFGGVHKKMVKLIPRNPDMEPFYVEKEGFSIKGKFVGLIRHSQD